MPRYRTKPIDKRLYQRTLRDGTVVYYGDFRDLAAWGGKQEALKPYGGTRATEDRAEAVDIARRRLSELHTLSTSVEPWSADRRQLAALASHYLSARAREQRAPTKQWMKALQRHLEHAAWYFGEDYDLAELTPGEVKDFMAWLAGPDHNLGQGYRTGPIHQHCCTLGAMYSWAQQERLLPVGWDPVTTARKATAAVTHQQTWWLEWDEVREMLRWLHEDYQPPHNGFSFLREVIATAVYTGGRRAEILRLQWGDIDFSRNRVRLESEKTEGKTGVLSRYVSLAPHLAEILLAHRASGRGKGLLFPARDGDAMSDLRRQRESIPLPTRFSAPEDPRSRRHESDPPEYLGFTMLRHSFCAARLQTLDRGAPIAKFTVQEEMGHASAAMIDRVYGHLGNFAPRAEHLDFR